MDRGARNSMAILLRAQILLGIIICAVLLCRVVLLMHEPEKHDPATLTISVFLLSFLTVCDRIIDLWELNRKIKRQTPSSRTYRERRQ